MSVQIVHPETGIPSQFLRKMFPSAARKNKYKLDTGCYPWVAYSGPRLSPHEHCPCFTDDEELQIKAIFYMALRIQEPDADQHPVNPMSNEFLALRLCLDRAGLKLPFSGPRDLGNYPKTAEEFFKLHVREAAFHQVHIEDKTYPVALTSYCYPHFEDMCDRATEADGTPWRLIFTDSGWMREIDL